MSTANRTPNGLLAKFIHALGQWLFKLHYQVESIGSAHIPAQGGVLLLGNHLSWIDWAVLYLASPRLPHFVIDRSHYDHWYTRWILDLFGAIPIRSAASAEALKKVAELLRAGQVVCLFPEGTITRTGQLAEFKRGYEKALQEAPDAYIIPFYIHGLWGSRFSRAGHTLRTAQPIWQRRNVMVAFGESLASDTDAVTLKQHIFALSYRAWQKASDDLPTIIEAWLTAAKRHLRRLSVADTQGSVLSNARFMAAVFSFGRLIAQQNPEQNVALLLPTSGGAVIANMAALLKGKTVVNLNYTASAESLRSAVQQTEVKRLFTSRRFVEKLKERSIDVPAIFGDLPLVYLEDMRSQISKATLISNLLAAVLLPTFVLKRWQVKPVTLDQTAAILFSSGSEGMPKGVELSQRNIATQVAQIATPLNPRNNEVFMATLPSFHAFGLTASTLLPLAQGIPLVCHPDPTDGLAIAKAVAQYQATVLFGTATFLRLYARNNRIHPSMFASLRLVVAGAEKLPPEVRRLFLERFNKTILEGYGATETSPVANVNIPDELDTRFWYVQTGERLGTVGLPLPGTCIRIVDPDNLAPLPLGEDGLILIGGVQVLKAYLNNPAKTADTIIEQDGLRWYKTGDKGHVDEDGFLTIIDRYSRFAKLGGEMVSLTAVELQVRQALDIPELDLVAVNLPDDKKGEKVVLLIAGEADPKQIRACLIEKQTSPLMIPAQIYAVQAVPRLGSGKTDFAGCKALALSRASL